MFRPKDLIISDRHDVASNLNKSHRMLEALTMNTQSCMEHLDLGSIILGEVVRLDGDENVIVAVTDGHKDDFLRVVAQPRLQTLWEDLGRV